jgi:hypothetical protein
MLFYLNMNCRVEIGDVRLENVESFQISESVDELSDTAMVRIPRNWKSLQGKPILRMIKTGDPIRIEAGYNDNYYLEFKGYVREIEADNTPITLHCEDEMYLLKQNIKTKTYNSAMLRQVLSDIMPTGTTIICPELSVGKMEINASTFTALNQIREDYGLYSRYDSEKKELRVSLRDINNPEDGGKIHSLTINADAYSVTDNFCKSNELRYKRKEDFKLQVEVSAVLPTGKKIKIVEGSLESDANKISFNYAGKHSEAELKKIAQSLYNKRSYDGFTGSITSFGQPRIHAGDILEIADRENNYDSAKYFIEKVTINYGSGGFERKCEISYKFV